MSENTVPTGKEVTARPTSGTLVTTTDPIQLAEHFARSGFFKDAADLSKAVVKITAGEELGFGPMASMQGIHIIEGKPSLSANMLAALVKRHPAYDFVPVRIEDGGAEITFLQNGEKIGTSTFTMKDAERAGIAGKQNFKRYPKAMMFARALSRGVRWYCPDVTAGSPAYVPEELGAEVAEEGSPTSARPVAVEQANGIDPIAVDFETAAAIEAETGQVTDAEVVEGLDPDRIEAIISGFSALKLSYKAINLLLGACGIDALRANSEKAARERLSELTPEQADAVDAELEREADNA